MASSGEQAVEARANGAAGADADSDCEWDFLLTAAPKAPQAPHNAQETKRCSKCKGLFPASGARKQCQRCRDYNKRYWTTGKGKASHKRYRASEKGKATRKRYAASEMGQACLKVGKKLYVASEKGKVAQKRYEASEKGKMSRKLYRLSEQGVTLYKQRLATGKVKASRNKYRLGEKGKATEKQYRASEKNKMNQSRYRASEKGRAVVKRASSKPVHRLSTSLRLMVKGLHGCPVTFPKLGIFADNSDAQAHFESTFLQWMNWSNQGQRLKDTLPNTVWQIGHRIPRAWYRHEDIGEIKKCWSRANLFAQCAVENIDARDRNILSQAQWLALKAIWPKQCAGMTDEEAWAWCRDNVDNATRRAARAAAKTAGPSDEAGPSDLRTVEDEEASSEDEGPVALDAYDSDALVFSDDSGDEASSDDEAD